MNSFSEFFDFLSFMSSLVLLIFLYWKFQNFIFLKFLGSEDGDSWVHPDGKTYNYPPKEIIHRFEVIDARDLYGKIQVYVIKDSWHFLSCILGGLASFILISGYYYVAIFIPF